MKGKAIGCDPGTMFFQFAEMAGDNIEYKKIRNAFIELEDNEETEEALSQNDWQYIYDETAKKYYIIGEDALKMARIIPGGIELRRPMQDGVLNKGEDKKMLVMADIIEKSIGTSDSDADSITTCISSPPADDGGDSKFHELRLKGMFKRLGWDVNVIEEGHAVILAENPVMKEEDGTESKYSGMGISFGAGRVNCVLAYKGKHILGMSAQRSGDWIDKQVAEATSAPISQVTGAKEKKLDFDNIDYDDDVIFALDAYYGEMIKYVFKHFANKFKKVQSEFPGAVEIVIAGGTSMPKGFVNKVKDVIEGLDLPFDVADVRHAKDPHNAVARGCMTHAIVSQAKKAKKAKENPPKKEEKKEKPVNKEEVSDNAKSLEEMDF